MNVRTDAAALALVVLTACSVTPAPAPAQPDVVPVIEAPDDESLPLDDPTSMGNSVEPLDVTLDTPHIAIEREDAWSVRSFTVYWENDGTVPKVVSDSDRHYTNGAKLELALNPSSRFKASVREFADRFDPMPDAKVSAGLVLAQHIYTSFDIRVGVPPQSARPYAGYLYIGGYVQRSSENVHDHLELDIGIIGPLSGAEATQKFVHSIFPNQNRPQGWGTQLGNEPTINLRYQRSWRFQKAKVGRFELDGIPRLGFDAGNVFVRANADLTLRLGFNLPDDFGPPRMLDYADTTGSWDGDWGVYVFVRGGARGVARNIFLDGNTFSSSRSVNKRFIVAEASIGLLGRYKNLEAGWSVTWLSEEFDTQGNGDSYGSLFARLSFPF